MVILMRNLLAKISFSDHLDIAFRAGKVDAALSSLVGNTVSALRANTIAAWTGTGLIASTAPTSTFSSSASSLPPSTA
jgi:hypothetical protein